MNAEARPITIQTRPAFTVEYPHPVEVIQADHYWDGLYWVTLVVARRAT